MVEALFHQFLHVSIRRAVARERGLLCALAAMPMLLVFPVRQSHAAEKWQGKATNMAGNFNYGKVTFSKSGSTIKNPIIEAVTTSGCGGYKNVFVPKVKIQGTRFSAKYQPIPGLNDFIEVSGTIRGSVASGIFSEGPQCSNSGKFNARWK